MKYTASFVLASAGWASALTQQCSGTAVDEGGNWFCGSVKQIMYEGIAGSGSFKGVTSMSETGQCDFEDVPYSGPLAPLDQDLSVHVRGPVQLKEFAVYHLGSASYKKRDVASSSHIQARRHGHVHSHKERKQKRAEWITATINGQVVSWENNYFGPATEAAPAPAAPTVNAVEKPPAADPTPTHVRHVSPAPKPEGSSENPPSSSSKKSNARPTPGPSTNDGPGGDWSRTSYYNAEQQVADNIVFLGNYGGAGSGVWDTTWGNSLAYLNSKGDAGCESPRVLEDVYIPSNKEFAIFSAEKCDKSCGYSRAEDVAYKGFEGANKIFLFRFKMPLDGDRGFNGDMPAIWALNARIPRTMQYGDCSCWQSGCGEADIYEVLASGDTKCKSTFHLQNGAGSSDYFDRPSQDFINVATVFDEKTASVTIKKLPDDFDFSSGLSDATVRGWIADSGDEMQGASLFQVAS